MASANNNKAVLAMVAATGMGTTTAKTMATEMATAMATAMPKVTVRISNATEVVENNPSPTATTSSRRLILQSTANITSQSLNSSVSDNDVSQSKTHLKEMHDRFNLLYKEYSDNGMKESSYHVTNFAGLYPIWPIIEFSMAPTGETKDDCMTSFSKCVVALLGEILYVDDTAKIATISITDDKSKYIGSRWTSLITSPSLGSTLWSAGGVGSLIRRQKAAMTSTKDSV